MANKTTTGITAASTPTGAELFYGIQGGNSRKFTGDQLRGMGAGGVAALVQGDLLYVGASGVITRLPKGTAGQVLMQNAGLTAPEWKSFWTELAAIATTSGTEKFWTSIPSGVTDIEIWFNGVSKSSTDDFLVQVGTGGAATSSGYVSGSGLGGSSARVADTTGFVIYSDSAADALTGVMRMHRIDGNTWVSDHSMVGDPATGTSPTGGGKVALAGALDIIRLVYTGGSQTFDAGSVQVRYR